MKRRGVQMGAGKKARAWQEESDGEPAPELDSEEEMDPGEELPEEEEPEAPAEEPAPAEEAPAAELPLNPVVWMKLACGDKVLPVLYIELFKDLCPKTAENFRQLCCGTEIDGAACGYRGCDLHRIVSGFVAQGGDFERGDGTGGRSIWGKTFPDESLGHLCHTKAGLLSMANSGPDTNGSQFFITLGPAPHLDGKHCIFGQVLVAPPPPEQAADGAAGGVEQVQFEEGVRRPEEVDAHLLATDPAAAPPPPGPEDKVLSPLRHLECAGSFTGAPRVEVVIAGCGELEEAQVQELQLPVLRPNRPEHEQDRYKRSGFSFPILSDVVTEENAAEVLDLVSKQVSDYERDASAVDNDEGRKQDAAKQFKRCEQLEVGLTRMLLLLDDVDYRSLGETRERGKAEQLRIKKLAAKIAKSKAKSKLH